MKLGVRQDKERGEWKPIENSALKLDINRGYGGAFGPDNDLIRQFRVYGRLKI